ncbi:MAG: glycosyltransferase [Nitrospirota bacterium]
MKFLLIHNFYQQPGGEDSVFKREGRLLEEAGHEVIRYTAHNNLIDGLGKTQLLKATLWNSAIYRELRKLIHQERPNVVHFHNTFPLISPAAYHAAKAENVAVVQTLHNYRLICPAAILFRNSLPCELCCNKAFPWPGIIHACYRESYAGSLTVGIMLGLHRLIHTWDLKVDAYIALTEFARKKFIEGGLPAKAIAVKPNFIHPDPCPGEGKGSFALFVGRLTQEKGIETLLAAWRLIGTCLPLYIVGDGPLGRMVAEAAERSPGITWCGRLEQEEVYHLMGEAKFVVVPSLWYETFGLVVIEAFAKGTPVIASKVGAIGELIIHEKTGLHFKPGDHQDLVEKVQWFQSNPNEVLRMRREARRHYEEKYTAKGNYELLMRIYNQAIRGHIERNKLG